MNSDLINRQDAIDALIGLDISDGVGISCIASGVQYSAIRAIEDLPSAEPDVPDIRVGKWIPCSKSLPEERQWVLCQCRAKKMEVLRINSDHDWEQLYPRRTYMGSFVLAWMPLPEPWNGGET